MVGAPPNVPVNFNERPKRTPDDQARERYAPQDPTQQGRGGRGGGRRWSRWSRRTDASARGTSLGAAGQSAHHAVPARQHAGAATHAAGRRTHSRRHRRAERRGPDLRRHHAAAARRHPPHRRLRPHLPHHRRRHAGDGRVQHLEPVLPAGQDVLRDRRRDPGHRQGGRSRDDGRPPRFVDERDRRDGQRDRLRDHDGGGAHPRWRSAPSRAARSASRSGAAKRKACSAHSHM